eukprot:TRINITY_DN78984_c0_g1_i1.p2 TRINITY_DN78984_c0_g1~~TRINITY_DN78984_c0_g1_i1.p2  ORF type:complete len:107 (+),score=2.16 TRINITY_DN78984_c0_g1_i1:102-422(+)
MNIYAQLQVCMTMQDNNLLIYMVFYRCFCESQKILTNELRILVLKQHKFLGVLFPCFFKYDGGGSGKFFGGMYEGASHLASRKYFAFLEDQSSLGGNVFLFFSHAA